MHQGAASRHTWRPVGGETEQTAPEMTAGSRTPVPSSPCVHWAQEVGAPRSVPQHPNLQPVFKRGLEPRSGGPQLVQRSAVSQEFLTILSLNLKARHSQARTRARRPAQGVRPQPHSAVPGEGEALAPRGGSQQEPERAGDTLYLGDRKGRAPPTGHLSANQSLLQTRQEGRVLINSDDQGPHRIISGVPAAHRSGSKVKNAEELRASSPQLMERGPASTQTVKSDCVAAETARQRRPAKLRLVM